MSNSDPMTKLATRVRTPRLRSQEVPAIDAIEPRRVPTRARVRVAGMLTALVVGAVAGCYRSAPVASSSDREPVEAGVKRSAPVASSTDRDAVEAVAKGFVKALQEARL